MQRLFVARLAGVVVLPRTLLSSCTPLLAPSVDLLWLYRRAAAVCEPGLRVVLEENVQTLLALAADLRESSAASSSPMESRLAFRRLSWRRHARFGLMHVMGNREHAWVALLARRESMLMRAFEHAARHATAADACVLGRQLPRLHALYLDMHSLAGTTAG